MNMDVLWTWKGEEVVLELTISAEDRSVGMMGPSIEGIKMLDQGKEIFLTEAEEAALMENEKLLEVVDEIYYGGPDEEYNPAD